MASETGYGAHFSQREGQPLCEITAHAVHSLRSFKKCDTEQSIPLRFEQQVLLYPDNIAVKTLGESLTYTQLNQFANQIARAILSMCSTDNESIGLFFEQGSLLTAAILGTLKAGKIYVPLDPYQSDDLNTEVLLDSTATLIITDSFHFAQAEALAMQDISVININEIEGTLATENIDLAILPDSPAYIFYTSGSTGRPKGVADSHRNVLHNVMRYTNSLRITANDRLTLLQPGNFSGSVSSLFCALLNGATSLPFNLRHEGAGRLATWTNKERVTIWHSVPSIFRLIATGNYKYPSLRIIRLEGDQATTGDLSLYKKYFPDSCVLINGLGATECGIVRQYFVTKKTPLPETVVPIGSAVEDMEILILDETKTPVEVNRVGEIAIRSRYLAPGYWRREELTRKVFLKDLKDERKRIYCTGDLGRMRKDGCLEYLGRKDFQQKLRGRWIDIPKVEKLLHKMEAFNDVVVITREDSGFDKRLVAYMSHGKSSLPGIDQIRQQLAQHLPEVMIPSCFVVLNSIPLNSFGKIARNALPPPEQNRPDLPTPYAAPKTSLERRLTVIWEALLNVRPIGTRDNFFDLGGDSLLAIQIISRVQTAFNVEISLRIVFEYPTITGQAEYMDKPAWRGQTLQVTAITTHENSTKKQDITDYFRTNNNKNKEKKLDKPTSQSTVHPRENFTF